MQQLECHVRMHHAVLIVWLRRKKFRRSFTRHPVHLGPVEVDDSLFSPGLASTAIAV